VLAKAAAGIGVQNVCLLRLRWGTRRVTAGGIPFSRRRVWWTMSRLTLISGGELYTPGELPTGEDFGELDVPRRAGSFG